MSKNLASWQRGASVGGGAALLWLAARRSGVRVPLVAAGAGLLIARGVSGYCPVTAAIYPKGDTRQALGGPRGIHVRESITIARPVAEIYAIWRNLSNLPTFMCHVERIDTLPGGRSRWVVSGPAGTHLEWDAEMINDLPNKLIAWRSLEGAEVVSAGSVRFRPTRRGATEVRIHLQYAPPAGKPGGRIATLLGSNPASQIREDLRSLKRALEVGETSGTVAHAANPLPQIREETAQAF